MILYSGIMSERGFKGVNGHFSCVYQFTKQKCWK